MARYTRKGPSLTQKQLTQIEQCLGGHPIPSDYRRFLLAHNGGDPSPAHFAWDHPERGRRISYVERFLGIDPRPLHDLRRDVDLIRIALSFRSELPHFTLPVGIVDRDSFLVVFTHGPHAGQIFIKDRMTAVSASAIPTPPESALYPVADSWRRLIDKLYDAENGLTSG